MIDFNKVPSPCYVMEEELLRKNLELIRSVKERAGVEIILAFKAFALWKSFPIIREYVPYATASSTYEAQLAYEEMGSPAHTFCPAYTNENFPVFIRYSSHIVFNSMSQFEKFYPVAKTSRKKVSCGIRVNPEYSAVETDLYNPALPGSRFGVVLEDLGDTLPEGVEGIHFHTLCESSSYELEKTLKVMDEKFGHLLKQAKWLNMGGGHLMTRADYDVEHLISILQDFKKKYPDLQLTLEPGSAFAWETGVLMSTVVDIVENRGVKTAILDVSFACHMPDCLEMPYKPRIRGAHHEPVDGLPTYRMGGCSCLSGDFIGDWSFDKPLQVGDKIIFEDMMHYTTVKTNMFNGVHHPSIAMWTRYNTLEMYREFSYEDYKNRMS